MLLGAHFSVSKGLHQACEEAARLGCNAVQIFTKNQRQWESRPIEPQEAERFCEARRVAGVECVLAHDSYLINLASADPAMRKKSFRAFVDEIERCERLSIEYLVTHPGSPRDAGEEAGLRNMAASLREALQACRRTSILLETTAGQGSALGWRFEQIARMIDDCGGHPRLGACFDTCHVFAAGYDLRSDDGYERTIREFDRIVGLDRLKAFHLNDSKQGLGSRVDRHEHIGRGKIGSGAFRRLVTDPRFERIPKVLETPKEDDMDARNLALLRSFARQAVCARP